MKTKSQDSQLIENYLKGDEKSLELLIAKYLKVIYGFVYKQVGSIGDAEDISQEVFIKVWKNIKKFDQNKNFKPWLFQIAKNTSIDFMRKKKTIPFSKFENEKGQNVLLENLSSKSASILDILSNKNIVSLAMQGLNEKEQKIINLRHEQGMSFKEISEVFQESINTIKSRYRRIINNIKGKTSQK
jgi:RNA polymerase sigma-70 factor (ECF subfamily)